MEILIRRDPKLTYVEGKMYIDGKFTADTLEPQLREIRNREDKVIGHTAIPNGRYDVAWTYSKKLRIYTPEIKSVPWFNGIRIHTGNTIADTAGCILVGSKEANGLLINSRITYHRIAMAISSAIARGERVVITIE